jgi:hypothetical protein
MFEVLAQATTKFSFPSRRSTRLGSMTAFAKNVKGSKTVGGRKAARGFESLPLRCLDLEMPLVSQIPASRRTCGPAATASLVSSGERWGNGKYLRRGPRWLTLGRVDRIEDRRVDHAETDIEML